MLARALARARLAIFWERLWPALASVATASACSWRCPGSGCGCGCRRSAAPIGLFVFFVLIASRRPCRWSSPAAGRPRSMDCAGSTASSGLPHRPATAIADRHGGRGRRSVRAGAVARASGAGAARRARAQGRHAGAAARRARSLCAARAGADARWSRPSSPPAASACKRIAAAFDWHGVVPPANFRIDAWVTPPTYTGQPPLILPGSASRRAAPARAGDRDGAGRQRRWWCARPASPVSTLPPAAASPRPRRRKPQRAQRHRGAPLHHQRHRHRDGARRSASDVTWRSTPSPTSRRPSRSPRTRSRSCAARCSSPTRSRTITA